MRYGPDMDRDDLAEMGDEACRSRDIRQGIPVDHDDGDFLNLLASEAHEARLERVNEFSAGNA